MNELTLFAVNLPPDLVAQMLLKPGGEAEVLHRLLGQPMQDPGVAELFAIKDLEGIGLDGFLSEGHGISEDELAPARARLAALEGYALILHPEAFEAGAAELDIGSELTLIARFSKPRVDWSDTQVLQSAAAQGTTAPAKKTPSDAAMSGRIAMLALLVLGLLTVVMVLVAS